MKYVMISLGRDLSNSYQKMMEYRGVFDALLEDVVEFEICPATLWMYLKKTGEKLIKVLFEVITYLENRVQRVLAGEMEDPTAEAKLSDFKDVTILAALHCSMDILEPVITLNTRTKGRSRLICEK